MSRSPYTVRWTTPANRDLLVIRDYIQKRSPTGMASVIRRIVAATRRLADFPEAAPIAEELGPGARYRRLVVTPYSVYYRLDGQTVLILRIWDTRRNPGDLAVGDP